MKMALAALLFAAPAFAATMDLDNDPAHTTATFAVKHMMVNTVRGQFAKVTSTLNWDKDDPTRSSVEMKIDSSSIGTRNEKRDGHLKSADFFDVEKYPTMTFKSTQVERKGEAEYRVSGDLTIHGVTKPVTFAVEGPSAPGKDPWGNTRIGLSATIKINRKDFGLNWNATLETGGILVGEDVQITVEAQFIKA